MSEGCVNCECREYIDTGKDARFRLLQDKMYSEWEVICKNCGTEYGIRFVQGSYIGFESIEL
ncbi:MAG: hypothetical protein ACRCX2_19425 [Paraclostridium sp.]